MHQRTRVVCVVIAIMTTVRGSCVTEKNPSERSADAAPVPANAAKSYQVTRADLPLHCPMDGMSLWNSHPRVYLPIESTGKAKCPYCGADYILTD